MPTAPMCSGVRVANGRFVESLVELIRSSSALCSTSFGGRDHEEDIAHSRRCGGDQHDRCCESAHPGVGPGFLAEDCPRQCGFGLVIIGGPNRPTAVVVPVLTTARVVSVGPLTRVSGCYWARERVRDRWLRFRVCG